MQIPKWGWPKARRNKKTVSPTRRGKPRGGRGPCIAESLEPRTLLSVSVTVGHYNTQNTGVNSNETILTPANVNTSSFGKLFSTTLDGQVYAETLVASGITITAGANTISGAGSAHTVVYVATEADSLYAIDANSGAILWYRQFANVNNPTGDINNTLGATAVTPLSTNEAESTDISPSIGITGTPVIDPSTNTIYVITQTAEVVNGQYNFVFRLHAISLSNGTDQVAPFMIGSTVNGVDNTPIYVYGTGYNYGSGDDGIVDPYNGTGKTVVEFNSQTQNQRAALSLVNGTLYAEWAAHGVTDPYHGWIATWNVSNLLTQGMVLSGVLCDSPNAGRGGIWDGGTGLSFEPDGSAFYFATGNGNGAGNPVMNAQGFPTDANYSDSVVKAELNPATTPSNQGPNGWGISIVDYFIPYNVNSLDISDTDVGSGGVVLLPPSAGIPGHPNLLLAGGKTGVVYLLDRDDLGHFNQFSDAALNSVPSAGGVSTPPSIIDGIFGSAAFYNGELYIVAGYGGPVEAFDINSNGLLTFVSGTAESNFGYLAGDPAISSNGANNGILWMSDRTNNELHALDPSNLGVEYWNSSQAAGGADALGTADKYDMPVVANGEVFVGTSNSLVAYGLKASASAVPIAPVVTAATTLSNAAVGLTWTDSTASPNTATQYWIDYSTDGTNFTQAATAAAGTRSITVAGLSAGTTYYFQIIGVNPFGNSLASNILSATTTGASASINFASGFGAAASSLIQLNGSSKIASNALVLVNNQQSQTGSAWYNTQQNIASFSTSFTFSLTGTWPLANGMTFTIQNDLATALGVGGSGLGYGDGSSSGTGGIPSSVAIKFDVYNTSFTGTTGLYTNGQYPVGGNSVELTNYGINLRSYDQMQVNMTYNGTVLSVTLTDLTTNKSETQNYTINIPAIVGGNTAWVGFTSGSGTDTILSQVFNWTYTSSSGGGVVTSPSAPSGLSSGTVTQSSANLTWIANSTNQTGYYLERATDAAFTANVVTQTLPATPNSFTDTDGLTAGATYYYQIAAFNSAGSSGESNVAKVVLPAAVAAPSSAPTGFTATAATSSVALSWTAVTGATSYTVSYGTSTGGPYTTTVPNISGTADTITGLTGGTPYFFIVTAVNSGGSGPNSAEATATPTVPLPAAPTGVTATPSNSAVTLNWAASALATGYNVKRASVTGGPYTTIASDITGTTFTDSPLTNGTPYFYVVSAIDATGEGANSAEVTATPSSAVLTLNFANGFAAAASSLKLNGNAKINGSNLQLTDNNPSEASSIYALTQQNVASFTTTFDFQITGSWPLGNGFTFVIQNSAVNALGQSGSGLGYGAPSTGNVGGIPNSVAIKFSVFGSQGEGNDSTGLYVNGAAPTSANSIDMTNTGFNLRSYDLSQAVITYNGTTLTVTLTDLVTKATATQNYTVNIPSVIGSSTAWVGFTASDGSLTSSQAISNWTYTVTSAAPAAPAAPTNLTATPGNGQAVLNWTASSGANSYTVAYGTTNGSSYTTTVANITDTTATITGLTNGTPYYFVVTAVNGGGQSANSTQASATPAAGVAAPAAPTGLIATAGAGQVALTWTGSSGATTYTISYGTTNGSAYTTVVNNIAGTTDTITGLTNGSPYYFVVAAVNSGGSSANSAQATATPIVQVTAPSAPTGITANAGSGQVTLNWTTSTGAASYTVLYGMTSGGAYPNMVTVTGTTSTITGLTNNTAYYFVITATNSAGTSANSTQTTATPTAAVMSLNYANGFTGAAGTLKLNGNASISGGSLMLTNNNPSQTSSVYALTQQGVAGFTTTFDFQITGSWPLGNGFTFVIQNSAVNALGQGGSGLGYGAPSTGNVGGIPNSVAIKFSVFGSQGEGNDSTGLYVNGAAPTSANSIDMTNTGFNLRSYDLSQAVITYNGTTLTVTLTDLVTKATATQNYNVNIPSVIGSGTAWVGFTASDGSLTSSQAITNWVYTATASGNAPAAPTGMTATPGNGQVTLHWAASTGATSYNVKYATTTGGPYTTVLNGITGTTDTITGLTNGTPYFFVVSAVSSGNESVNSAEAAATPAPPVQAPAAPTGLNTTAGNGQVALTWTPSTGATSYTVSYATTTGGPYTVFATGVATASDTVTNLTNNTPYFFVVSAVNSGGASANSGEATATPAAPLTAPAAPTGLIATPGNGQVALSWTGSTGATSYNVKYATSGSGPFTNFQTGVATTTFTVTSLTNGTPYFFVVSAVNGGGESGNSGQAAATPMVPVTPPAAPTGLTAVAGGGQVSLNWTSSTGATSYIILYGMTTGGPYPNSVNVNGTTDTITGLTNGTAYYFVVLAVNSGGDSANSTEATATPSGSSQTTYFPAASGTGPLTLNGNAAQTTGNLVLTDNSPSEISSFFGTAQQNISSFSTVFDFVITGTWPLGNGFTFVIQDAGINALGQGGSGLGYGAPSSGNVGGIPDSVAVKFSIFGSQGEGNDSTGLYTDGAAPTSANSVDMTNSGFNLRSYDPSQANITYDGTTLTVTLTDLVTMATDTQNYTVNIPAIVGGSTAWVGFTASDGSLTSSQDISSWTYTSNSSGSAPGTPANVTATAGNGQVALNWNASPGATSYNVRIGTSSGGPYTTVLNGITGTSDTITGLTNGTPYFFVVSAVSSGNESTNSTEATATPVMGVIAPSAPTGLQATAGNGQVSLSWTPSAGAVTYNIKYSLTSGGPYTSEITGIAGTSTTVPSLANGTPYFFVVSAVNSGGESTNSGEATATPVAPLSAPSAPATLTATAGNGQATLNWAASAGATSYNVKYGTTNGGPYTTVLNVVSGTTDILTGLANGTPYFFVVSALNAAGESANSTQASATPVVPITPPAAPTGLTAAAGSGQVTLNWTASTGATSYTVNYGTSASGPYTSQLSGIAGTTATVTGLTNGTTYYFAVAGVNTGGAGANSAQASATPAASSTTLSFPNGFANAAGALKLNGSAVISAGSLMLTNNNPSQTSSVYALAQQGVGAFTTTFDFQITGSWPLGNGFTFVIQNSAVNAIGQGGSGLGYGAPSTGNVGGIPNSVAIKFSVFGSQGEGNDSTGLYVNGAAPTSANSIDMTNTGFNLRSYDLSQAVITYNGTTLTVTLTDLVTKATATQNYNVNIPSVIGSSTAWVGFTASDGSLTSSQAITNWTYTATAAGTVPAAPTGVTATPGNGQVTLNWSAASGASTYNVKYGTTTGGPYTTVLNAVTGTTDTITGLTNGTPYFFVVSAVNAAGESANSTEATATPGTNISVPAAPTGLTPTAGNGQVALTWTASTGATSYNVKYSTTSGGSYTVFQSGVSGTTDTVTGLSNGTPYFFVVSAVNATGEGANSSQATATPTTGVTAPSAPTGLTATAGNGQVALSWSASSGAATYTVSYGTTNGSAYSTVLNNISGTTDTITGLTNGTPYYFVVAAVNTGGSSANSAQASATPVSNSTTLSYPNGFAGAAGSLQLDGAAHITGSTLALTDNNPSETSSVFATTQQNVAAFSTTFDFQITGSWPLGNGFTFVIQDSAVNALGQSGAGLGYGAPVSGNVGGIPDSVAVKFSFFGSQGEGNDSTGLYIDGAAPTSANSIDLSGTAFNLRSYDMSQAVISYNGTTLTETLTDLVTKASVTETYTVNIPGIVGSSLAWIGFTASDGSLTSSQDISSWTYTSMTVTTPPPATPAGVTATPGNGQATLNWAASTGATGYNVQYATASGGPYTLFQSNVAGTTEIVTGLTNGTPYFFEVAAVNAGGTSSNSTPVTATPTNTVSAPAAPTGLTASAGAAQVSLSWTASAGAVSYNVKYGTNNNGPYPNVVNVTTGTAYTVANLANGTTYYFVVSAVNSGGESANAAQVSATPTASLTPINFPTGFTSAASSLTFNGTGSARINSGALYLTDDNRSEKGSAWFDQQENITSFNTTFDFVIDGSWPLGCGFTFTIQDVGLNALGQGGSGLGYGAATTGATGGILDSVAIKFNTFSSEGQGTDSTGLYTDGAAPAILNSVDMTSSGFNLRSYDLSQCTLSYDGTTLTETLTDLVTKATFTEMYTVNIPAIVGSSTAWIGFTGGDGDETSNQFIDNWTYATTPPTAPAAPSGVAATVANDQVTLNWNASVGASSYTVSYGTTTGGPYTTVLSGVTATTDTITGLTDGTPYFFIVSAVNTFGTSGNSAEVAATPALSAPSTPTGLTATPGDGQVILNWFASLGGASSYTVSYGTASGTYTTTIPGIAATTYVVTGLTDGTPYYFAVAAVNASGSSTNSVEASATPSPSGPATSANFSTGFAGAASSLTLNGSAALNGSQLELLNNNGFESSSAFDQTPQNIATFSTEFEFQITGTWPIANGFTFVIQDAGLNALGQGGGGLGYGAAVTGGTGGIPDSVAVKFDIFSTQGEGTDSTGLYTDGAAPTGANSIDLTNSGFNLRSYDPSTCQLSYDGATLTETLTDLVTNATVTETYLVNIPQIVGGNTAYLGFTAGDGSEVSLTAIQNWTYASGSTAPAAPTNVSGTGGGGQIKVNWSAAPGAFSYSVEYGQANGGPYPTVVSGILGTSNTITGLTGGQTYYIIVTSFDLFGQSLGSTQIAVTA